jgi:hypothetical protein
MADPRRELSADEVARMIDAIYRRAYRIRNPFQRDTFRYMMEQLEGRETVGPDPEFLPLLPS